MKNELSQLKSKSESELKTILAESREKLRALKFDLMSGKIKNVAEIHRVKTKIAQALTLINQIH